MTGTTKKNQISGKMVKSPLKVESSYIHDRALKVTL